MIINFSKIETSTMLGKYLRKVLQLIPPDTVLPILQGPMIGMKWQAGSSVNGCWLGSYEKEKQLLMKEYIKPRQTVFDVGANVGFYVLLSAKIVGKTGKVVAFEPVNSNVEKIKRHIKINKIENCIIEETAIGKEVGEVKFQEGTNNSVGKISSNGSQTVKIETLDSYCERTGLIPDCIKIDVEGAEADVLIGAEKTLRKGNSTIFLATHGTEVHKKCCKILTEWGYELRNIDDKPLEQSSEILCFKNS